MLKKYRIPRKRKKEIRKNNKKLVLKYPFLLPRNVWTDKLADDYAYDYIRLKGEIPDGWWKRFGIPLCEDLKEVLVKYNYLHDYRFSQCKEKYGSIHLYDFGAPEEWFDHLHAWEYISEHTCVECGKFPVPMRCFSWISPYCDTHAWHEKEYGEEEKAWIAEENWTGKVQEYITIKTYSSEGEREKKIDMKPFYDKIGYDYKKYGFAKEEE